MNIELKKEILNENKDSRKLFPLLVTIIVSFINIFIHGSIFLLLRDGQLHPITLTIIAVLWGSIGFYFIYMSLNWMISFYPKKWGMKLQPFIFVGPAIFLLAWLLLIPTFRTIWMSFYDASGSTFVGLSNYVEIFTNKSMLLAVQNTFIWVVLGTFSCVSLGLIIAVLADRSSFEKIAKSIIFMPIAISFVGAGVIWKFIYAYRPDENQIGLLNAIVQFFGGEPKAWITLVQPWNNLFLIIILIWMMTGFAMVIFSAAIKGVPQDILEAARIDGANEITIFFKIIIPYIKSTIVAVTTTIVIFTMKIFDIVMVMTGGQYGTEVIATEFYTQYFLHRNTGIGSSLAILLLVAVLPVIFMNMNKAKKEEGF